MAKLLIDNWTLQEIAHILNHGLATSRSKIYTGHKLDPSAVPSAAIQIDSLFNILLDLILRDKLVVDGQWTKTWLGKNEILDLIHSKGFIESYEFELDEDFYDSRDYILDSINLDKAVVKKHHDNVAYWKKHTKNKHEVVSVVVSGTAGYLTRGNILSSAYSPHPIRANFLKSTRLHRTKPNAHDVTMQFIERERIKLIRRAYGDDAFTVSKLILSPLIIEMIESSSSVNDLFLTAFQMRTSYQKFRKHFSSFQKAMDEGDLKKIQAYGNMLSEISPNETKDKKYGGTELSLGSGLIKLNKIPLPSLVSIKNRFGIRSSIKKLIFKNASEGSIDKLFGFFDERNNRLISEIKDYFAYKRL
jgi:hypothetical protein